MRLAADFGCHLSDPDFRLKAWDLLAQGWSWGAGNDSTKQVWKTWTLAPQWCGELLQVVWDRWAADPNPNVGLLSGQIFSATVRTIQLWAEAGAKVSPSDLASPQLLYAFERLAKAFPASAVELRTAPVLGSALAAAELDRSLNQPSTDRSMDASRPRLRF